MPGRDVIVLAAPNSDDPYYADQQDAIIAFHAGVAAAAAPHDDVLILADRRLAPVYTQALGAASVLVAPQEDIWIRDFAPAVPGAPVQFRYTAEGQGGGRSGQRDADFVQDALRPVMRRAALSPRRTRLLNDGGNIVEDGTGRAVLSRKFLRDNQLTETEAREALRAEAGFDAVAFIEADEQGGLEHADGVVAFVAPGVLVANAYPTDPAYEGDLHRDLRAGLPDIEIHSIPAPYDDSVILDPRFGSACGLYVNLLVTRNALYLPAFGRPEDAAVAAQIAPLTDKPVIPVRCDGVCAMGGGLRCMSWRLTGDDADRLRALRP